MRLFSVPDGSVDRSDRAMWLTMPFDIQWRSVTQGPYRFRYRAGFTPGKCNHSYFAATARYRARFAAGARDKQGIS